MDNKLKESKSKNKVSTESIKKSHVYVNAYNEKADQENWRKLAEAWRVANIELAWHGTEKEADKIGI
jgi:uncharacterized protein (UPF0276 family)